MIQKKTASVLATGPSLKNYVPDGSITFGVNKIWKYHPVDYLVILDELIFAGPDAKFIVYSSPKKLFFPAHLENDPIASHEKTELISLFPWGKNKSLGSIEGQISAPYFYHSIFTAVSIAFLMGFERIVLHGADFGSEYQKPISDKELIKGWKEFHSVLLSNGCSLFLGSEFGTLKEVVPIIKSESSI